jgi:hypothetical protein
MNIEETNSDSDSYKEYDWGETSEDRLERKLLEKCFKSCEQGISVCGRKKCRYNIKKKERK